MSSDDPSDYEGMEKVADLSRSDFPGGEEEDPRDDSAELEEFGSLLSLGAHKSPKTPMRARISEEHPAENAPPSDGNETSGRSHWRAQIGVSAQQEDEGDSSIVSPLRWILGWVRR